MTDEQGKIQSWFPTRKRQLSKCGERTQQFCAPASCVLHATETEHFLKLSLSFSGVHIENQRWTGIYKHTLYFFVGMLLFFNALSIEMGNSAIQGKMYIISYHYVKNPLQFLLNGV